jgi:hypothetical protein
MKNKFKKFLFFKKDKIKADDLQNMTAAQIASYLNRNEAAASDMAIEGMDLFREAAKKHANVDINISQGNLFEYIEAAKFNMEAARKGFSNTKAVVTAADGAPHAAADMLIKKNNTIVAEIQAKSSDSTAGATYMISDEKYRGMQKLVNSDKAEPVRDLATRRASMGTHKQEDYLDTAKNVTGETHYGEIRSGGTSYNEAKAAAENPELYAKQFEMNQFKQELMTTTTSAAVTGGVMGGAISVIKNGFSLYNDEVDAIQAGKNIAKDTIKSGTRAGATGALGTSIRVGAQKADLVALGKGNVATSLAAGVIDCGVTIYSYAKGEISAEVAMERMGQTSFSTASSIFSGLVVGVAFGPGIIATMGSVAGYMLATHVYQNCIAIFKSAKLAEEEADRLVALLNESIEQMKQQRALFEQYVEEQLKVKSNHYKKCFKAIESGLESGNPTDVVQGLQEFTGAFGHQLKLVTFEEFDDYMKKNDTLHL